jgi:hypothetical protein
MHLTDDTGRFRAICFDFDGKDRHGVDAELMERAVDECDALSGILTELTIAHVVCQSSDTGGRHIWLALQDGAPAESVASVARGAAAERLTEQGVAAEVVCVHEPRPAL